MPLNPNDMINEYAFPLEMDDTPYSPMQIARVVVPDRRKINPKGRPRRLRAMKPPKKGELIMRREIVRAFSSLFVDETIQATNLSAMDEWIAMTAPLSEVMAKLEAMRESFRASREASRLAQGWVEIVSRESRLKMQRELARAIGVDHTTIFDDYGVAEKASDAAHKAAALIESIPDEYYSQVEQAVLLHYQQKPQPEGRSLIEQIQHVGGVSRERAIIIARDQTSKMNSAINQARNEALGIEEYIWRTSKDSRVVGNPGGHYPKGNPKHMDHYHRNGKTFRWDDPPPDGHPGEPILCRCWAESIVDMSKLRMAA